MYVINDVWYIVLGLAAGLVAHRWARGKKPETVADEAVGLLGALLGGYIAAQLNIPFKGFVYALGVSAMGAVALLTVLHLAAVLRRR